MALGGDSCFTRAMKFSLTPGIEGLIGSVPEDYLLNGGVKMICRGLILTRRGAEARRQHVEELSRLEHQLQEVSSNLKQVVEANIAYEKKLCSQAEKAVEITRLRKALKEVERKGAFLEGEFASLRQGKEATEAEVLKTMEDTMVLITQSFDLAVRQAGVLYGGLSPSGQFDQEMEVFNGQLVPANEVLNL